MVRSSNWVAGRSRCSDREHETMVRARDRQLNATKRREVWHRQRSMSSYLLGAQCAAHGFMVPKREELQRAVRAELVQAALVQATLVRAALVRAGLLVKEALLQA